MNVIERKSAREWAKTRGGLYVRREGIVRARGTGHLSIRDRAGREVYKSKYENMLPTAGLTYLLNNNMSSASLYFGIMNNAAGTNTASGTSSSGSITSGSSVSWTQNQHVTIIGAGTSGANYSGQITTATGSGTSFTVSPTLGTTVSGAVLVLGPVFAAGDTYSGTHASWAEVSSTIAGSSTRPTFTGVVSSGAITNSASPAAWTIGTAATQWICGFFLIANNTVGTTGTLISEFAPNAGAASIQTGYTMSLTYTLTLSSTGN